MDLLSIWSLSEPQKPHMHLLLQRSEVDIATSDSFHFSGMKPTNSCLSANTLASLSLFPMKEVSHLHLIPFSACSKKRKWKLCNVDKADSHSVDGEKQVLVRGKEMGLGCCVRVEKILAILGEDQRSQNHRWLRLSGTVSWCHMSRQWPWTARGRVATTFLNLWQLKIRSFHSLTQFCCLKKESIKSYFGLILEVAQVSRGYGAGGAFSTQGKRKRQDIVNFTSCWRWWFLSWK